MTSNVVAASTKHARIANLGLQAITSASRFIFIFFLAKYLDPALVGYYGIFAATVSYALYFVGLDFYTYTSREILKTRTEHRGRLLKGQAALAAILYLCLLPPTVWLLQKGGWPIHLILWFPPILCLEHFNQEISRLLIVLSKQIAASAIVFIRQGSWALAAIVLMSLDNDYRSLNVIMALWATAGASAALLGLWKLHQLKICGWQLKIDWIWVKKGILTSMAFLTATLALRGIQTFDRYWLEELGSIEDVATYVLLLGVASALLIFLDATLFSFAYPTLIQLNQKKEHETARRKVNRLFAQTLTISVAFGFLSWLLLPLFLSWVNNPIYQRNMHWYPWLISAVVINAVSMVPHFALYAREFDQGIIISHIAAVPAFGIITLLLSSQYDTLAVPMGLNAAFITILAIKTYTYYKTLK